MGSGAANRKKSRLCRKGTVIRAQGIETGSPYLREVVNPAG